MKQTSIKRSIVVIVAMMLLSCFGYHLHAQSSNEVSYKTENRYFVHGQAKDGLLKLVIKNQKDLDKVFGVAYVGPMSPVDFDQYFMIVVVVPDEIAQARVKPVSLKREGGKLKFYYTIDKHDRTSTANRSYVAVLVSRNEPTKVDFQEVSSTGENVSNAGNAKSLNDQLEYIKAENELLQRQLHESLAQQDALRAKLADAYQRIKALEREKESWGRNLR